MVNKLQEARTKTTNNTIIMKPEILIRDYPTEKNIRDTFWLFQCYIVGSFSFVKRFICISASRYRLETINRREIASKTMEKTRQR